MEFERIVNLANATPMTALREAWAATPEYVDARKRSQAPMTIREAGALAELHGLKLLDVLPV